MRIIRTRNVELQSEPCETDENQCDVRSLSAEEVCRTALEYMPIGILVLDGALRVLYVNKALCTERPEIQKAIGQSCYTALCKRPLPCTSCPIRRVATSSGQEPAPYCPAADMPGHTFTKRVVAVPVRDHQGMPLFMVMYLFHSDTWCETRGDCRATGNQTPRQVLTPRENQIADLVKEYLSSKEIAAILCISKSAVDYHRANIRKKLHLARGDSLCSFLRKYFSA